MPPFAAPLPEGAVTPLGPVFDSPQNRAMVRILQYLLDADGPDEVAHRAVSGLRMLPEIAHVTLRDVWDGQTDIEILLASETGSDPSWLTVKLVDPCDALAIARVRALTDLVTALHRRERDVRQLRNAAHTDPLTQLCNRRGFEPFVDQALARAARTGEAITLMLCDVDRFKAINDKAGHQAGDEALLVVARAMQSIIRPTDLAARTGGDEFAILLAGASAQGAAVVANRLREAISFANPLTGLSLTLSIGIADTQAIELRRSAGHEPRYALFRAADEALYRVKARGRDGHALHQQCFPVAPLEIEDTLAIATGC